jgi:histidine kinase-like protein
VALDLDPVTAGFAPETDAPSRARHFVASTIAPWTTTGDCETAVLLVSELVTNAVVHARTAVEVEVRVHGSILHVEVRDRRPNCPVVLADASAEHGRGLQILDGFATAWGTVQQEDAKAVWFDLSLARRDRIRRPTPPRLLRSRPPS